MKVLPFWPAALSAGGVGLVVAVAMASVNGDDARARLPEIPIPEVVFVGTPHDVVAAMLELAKVDRDDLLYDLGSGDGRIVIAAARDHGSRAVGFELDPVLIRESMVHARRNGIERLVRFELKDIYTVDLKPASVVALYLLPDMIDRLLPQLETMRPGARVVTNDYGIPGYPADASLTMVSKGDGVEHTVSLWTLPLRTTSTAEQAP